MMNQLRNHRTGVLSSLMLIAVLALTGCSGGAAATATPPTPVPEATVAPPAESATAAVSDAPVTGMRTFVIDTAASSAAYLADETFFGGALEKLGIAAGEADVVGVTRSLEGQLQLDLGNLSAPLGDNRFTVRLDALETGESRRDTWIREDGPRFNEYPLASFVATAVGGAPAGYTEGEEVSFELSGDLTIREVTQPVTFAVTAKLAGDTLTGIATAQLKMSDFGIEPPNFANTLTVEDAFGIRVEFTAKE